MNDQQNGGILAQVVNAIDKDEREALKKVLRGKVTELRKAKKAVADIEASIIADLEEAGHGDAATVADLLD